jgi:phage FluMu protein Com
MPMLKVRCGRCDAVIPTGTEMSYETFRNATFQQLSVECPNCEHVQTWTSDDVDQSVFKEART